MTSIQKPNPGQSLPIKFSPDTFNDVSGTRPSDDFVISRHRDGSVASRFGDLKWDRTAYDPDGRQRWLYFPFSDEENMSSIQDSLSRETRWVLFLILMRHHNNDASFSSLDNFLGALRAMASFCEKRSMLFTELLASEASLVQLLDSGLSGSNITSLRQIINILLKLGEIQTGYKVPGNNLLRKIKSRVEAYQQRSKQHPPIPTRIYSSIIAAIGSEIEGFERIAPQYLALLRECNSNPLTGKSRSGQWAAKKRHGLDTEEKLPSFPELLERYALTSYFKERGLSFDSRGLISGLVEVQMAAKLQIQVFSGMRSEEAQYLPYNCLEIVVSSNQQHPVIHGRTTKLNRGRSKRVRWVTSREGQKAIHIAQLIAECVYAMNGESMKVKKSIDDRFPLFVSSGYMPCSSNRPVSAEETIYLPSILNLPKFQQLRDRLTTLISDEDLRELEQIDPHRAWRLEKNFKIGNTWILTSSSFPQYSYEIDDNSPGSSSTHEGGDHGKKI